MIRKYMHKCNYALHILNCRNTAQPENEIETIKNDASKLLYVFLIPESKLAFIKRIAWAMLRVLQEQTKHQGIQH